MSADTGVTDPARSAVLSVRDLRADEAVASDDGCSRSGSEQEEDYEEVSTRKVSEISTGVLHVGGTPSNIHMENSSDVHIGSRLNYNAPVTINQCVHVLRNSDVIQDGVMLREAIRGPVHVVEPSRNSSATLISLNHKVQGTSSLYGGTGHCSGVIAFCRRRRVCLTVILLPLMIMLVAVIVYFCQGGSDSDVKKDTSYPPPTDPEPNPNTTLPGDHRIYSKEDWNGEPPKYERKLRHPTPFVVISHTASHPCFSPVKCAAQMRIFQDLHVGSAAAMPDVGYSFAAGGDGNVYEGRGWDATNMHSGFVMRCNIGITFIGNFVQDTPTNGQIEAVQELIKLGVRLGKIAEDYKLLSMNETYNSLSPGVVVYGIISKWPHFWSPSADDIGVCPYQV